MFPVFFIVLATASVLLEFPLQTTFLELEKPAFGSDCPLFLHVLY